MESFTMVKRMAQDYKHFEFRLPETVRLTWQSEAVIHAAYMQFGSIVMTGTRVECNDITALDAFNPAGKGVGPGVEPVTSSHHSAPDTNIPKNSVQLTVFRISTVIHDQASNAPQCPIAC